MTYNKVFEVFQDYLSKDQGYHFPQFRQLQVDNIAVNGNFSEVGTEIVGAVLLHLHSDLFQFLL